MSAYKPFIRKLYRKDQMIHKMTPSASWHGGKEFIGKVQMAVLVDGRYLDDEGGIFVVGEGHWEVVEEVK